MNEWNIRSRAHTCQACEKAFVDKQPYHTVLFDDKREFLRQDICDPCWQAQFGHGSVDKKGFVSRWQGVYEAPPAAPPEAIQKDTAESLLRKLIEQGDPRHAPASFILAVMLERKRLLKVKEQFLRDGRRTFIYEQPRTGDIFTIPDPGLQLNQLEAVQRDVANLLEHGLPGVEASPPTPASAEKDAAAPPEGTPSTAPPVETPAGEPAPVPAET